MIQKNINKLFRRREAEDKLRLREHRYRIMIESNPLGVILMDHEGVIQDCNDAFVELMGSSRDKLIGFKGTESTIPEMQQVIKKALAGEVGIFEGEYTSITGSKTAYLRMVYNPVNPGGNLPTDIIATVEDVSARKRAEEEIRTASERMKAIFGSIKDPILVHPYTSNGHGIFSEVNDIACTRYGYTREEFLQISVKNLLKQDSDEALLAPDRLETIITKGHMVFETVHVTKNGEEFPVEVSVCTMDQAGKKYVLAVVRDITERHIAQREKAKFESQLQRVQKLESLGILAGGIAHDFNNILTGIMGNISFAQVFIDTTHKSFMPLVEAEKAAVRAGELAHQLLTFARGGKPIKKVVSLQRLVNETFSFVLRGSNVKATVDIPDSVHAIEADEGQMSQVFQNLTINAMQAMPGGELTVSAQNKVLADNNSLAIPPGTYIKLLLTDQGCGISEDNLTKIFDPYFTTKSAGNGLGLASVHSIINRHGGHIGASSIVGKGTTFTIFLPSLGELNSKYQTDISTPAIGEHKGGSILVMDDEEIIRDIASAILTYLGYKVTTCASGEKAVELYKTSMEAGIPFLTVIMDLTIPGGLGGKEAAEQILTLFPKARLIVSSGYSNDSIMSSYKEYGFSGAITKPYNIHEVKQVLSSLLPH